MENRSPIDSVNSVQALSYRLRESLVSSTDAVVDKFHVNYRLSVMPIARERDGYRLRLIVSDVERPEGRSDGMNMVVAAALMLDSLPIEMLVDARGFLQEVADWPVLQRTLRKRADALAGGLAFRAIAYSVVDHDAKQVAWHLVRAIEAMNFARSYLDLTQHIGPSTISWYVFPIDVTVEPDSADGAVIITWAAPSRANARPSNEGRAKFRRDGFTARLVRTSIPPGVSDTTTRDIIAIEELAAN